MSARPDARAAGATAARIRPVTLADRPAWLAMRRRLWPELGAGEHERDAARILENRARETALLCVGEDDTPLGFAEVSRREFVDGCASGPVGYLEALYVEPEHRRRRLARELVDAAESWARARGCRELASDATLDNTLGQAVHERLGFEETARLVLYRKPLRPAAGLDESRGAPPTETSPESLGERAPDPLAPAAADPGPRAGPWRPGPVDVVVFVLGALAFWFTDVFSGDVFYGAVLPIVDVLVVMYVIGLIVVVKYRSKTGMGASRGIHEAGGDS